MFTTLGVAGVSSHTEKNVNEYNKLLNILGVEGMLIQFERWIDEEELEQIIQFAKDNLRENGIKVD